MLTAAPPAGVVMISVDYTISVQYIKTSFYDKQCMRMEARALFAMWKLRVLVSSPIHTVIHTYIIIYAANSVIHSVTRFKKCQTLTI